MLKCQKAKIDLYMYEYNHQMHVIWIHVKAQHSYRIGWKPWNLTQINFTW